MAASHGLTIEGLRVFTIPADVPFLPALARAILAGGFPQPDMPPPQPLELADWTVLLPTRRAVRALTAAFLTAGGGRALILPRIRPLGDVDEDEFAFAPLQPDGTALDIPPAIPETQLMFLLARLIDEWLHGGAAGELGRSLAGHPGQVFHLARSLMKLIESFETEELSLDALGNLLGPEFAAHRQAMLDFLAIIRTRLPQELEAAGLVGQAKRRSLLMRGEARRLAAGPHGRPIIAAGSTGTIPATANLLEVIAGLPRGAVVLPGLDQDMDEESWQATLGEEGHPQHGLHRLLHAMGIGREDVAALPGIPEERPGLARLWLASELMRPVATSDRWHEMVARSNRMVPALAGLEIIEAADETREALVAALILRGVLERCGATASLVTPNRRLARRVKSELGRWGIDVADSAGEPAARQPAGTFLRLIAEWGVSRAGVPELAALVKHPLFRLGRTRAHGASLAERLEIAVLRGLAPAPGLESLQKLAAARRAAAASTDGERAYLHPAVRRLYPGDWSDLARFLAALGAAAAPFLALCESNEPRPLRHYLKAHLEVADRLAATPGDDEVLWRGPEGEVLAELFADLLRHADRAPALSPGDYLALLTDELDARPVRLPDPGHPRLAILGLLEARLIKPDVVILSGLNQGIWPPEPRVDPWLSRPMKDDIGLAQAERRIGLAAHDFIQHFAAGEVYLTSARKIDGEPAVPSRFLLRLQALVAASGQRLETASGRWLDWSAAIDSRLPPVSIEPAMPAPAVNLRPRSLSVTRIIKLIESPYTVFAENVLALRELDPVAKPLGRGRTWNRHPRGVAPVLRRDRQRRRRWARPAGRLLSRGFRQAGNRSAHLAHVVAAVRTDGGMVPRPGAHARRIDGATAFRSARPRRPAPRRRGVHRDRARRSHRRAPGRHLQDRRLQDRGTALLPGGGNGTQSADGARSVARRRGRLRRHRPRPGQRTRLPAALRRDRPGRAQDRAKRDLGGEPRARGFAGPEAPPLPVPRSRDTLSRPRRSDLGRPRQRPPSGARR